MTRGKLFSTHLAGYLVPPFCWVMIDQCSQCSLSAASARYRSVPSFRQHLHFPAFRSHTPSCFGLTTGRGDGTIMGYPGHITLGRGDGAITSPSEKSVNVRTKAMNWSRSLSPWRS
jgi:hypothetical protein